MVGSLEVHSTAIQIFDSVEQMAIYFVKDYSNQQLRQEIGLEAKAIGNCWEWMGMDGNGWGVGCINRYIFPSSVTLIYVIV